MERPERGRLLRLWLPWLIDRRVGDDPRRQLIVDLVDARTKDCIWRGTAQDEVTGKGEDRGKAQEAANKLFENFPPRPTGK